MSINRNPPFRICGLGELIWDLLPNGPELGGAPSNFAQISSLLGDEAMIASRVGSDDLGDRAVQQLGQRGIDVDYVQRDSEHPTGTVDVTIGPHGEPDFCVNQNSAWDYLDFTNDWRSLAGSLDAVCFGTLGQRNLQARETIDQFLSATRPDCLRVFDVNLRHSFFTRQLLERCLEHASIIKLNHDELEQVGAMFDLTGETDLDIAGFLERRFEIDLIAVTRGARGCLLVSPDGYVEDPGFRVSVTDTIGAGDAFAAMMVNLYLRGIGLREIAEMANRIGAWITTMRGATPWTRIDQLQDALMKLERNR